MFERLYTLLLRLYPAEFRRAYEQDARQLIRDRARDERGAFLRLRLLIDLVRDLTATSLTWQPPTTAFARVDGTPQFTFIEPHRPKPQAMLAGTLASLMMLAAFGLLFQPKVFPPAPLRLGEGSGAEPTGFEPAADPDQQFVVAPGSEPSIVTMVADTLRERYYDFAIGQQLANALLAFDKNGHYKGISGHDLADRLNEDIYNTSRALGIAPGLFVADVVFIGERPTPPIPPNAQNCLFQTIETLPRNIGHLKLDGFMPPPACRNTAKRAMEAMNNTDALIIDLRDNGGGMGETALQIAAYLFDRPAFLFDPRSNSQVPTHTASPVVGSALADKQVYLLTSRRTASAAEYFTYNLKMLERVTIVGERTAGAMHAGAFHRLADQWGVGIQEASPPDNPYPLKGWERIGVEPHIAVPAGEAFTVARTLAESETRRH